MTPTEENILRVIAEFEHGTEALIPAECPPLESTAESMRWDSLDMVETVPSHAFSG